jgi:hypothetical protein
MDSCITCDKYPDCIIYRKLGMVQGCAAWIPIDNLTPDGHNLDIRRSLDEGRPVEQGESEMDGLSTARGILLALVIGLVVWAFIWAVIVLF